MGTYDNPEAIAALVENWENKRKEMAEKLNTAWEEMTPEERVKEIEDLLSLLNTERVKTEKLQEETRRLREKNRQLKETVEELRETIEELKALRSDRPAPQYPNEVIQRAVRAALMAEKGGRRIIRTQQQWYAIYHVLKDLRPLLRDRETFIGQMEDWGLTEIEGTPRLTLDSLKKGKTNVGIFRKPQEKWKEATQKADKDAVQAAELLLQELKTASTQT